MREQRKAVAVDGGGHGRGQNRGRAGGDVVVIGSCVGGAGLGVQVRNDPIYRTSADRNG